MAEEKDFYGRRQMGNFPPEILNHPMYQRGVEANLDPDCFMFLGDYEDRTISKLVQHWLPGGCTVLGATTVFFHNHFRRRPWFSNVPGILVASLVGLGIGCWMEKFKNSYLAERDVQLFHYMTLHPEDFQPKEKVKYRDYLTSWIPIR